MGWPGKTDRSGLQPGSFALAGVLAAGWLWRLGYSLAQPATDPGFERPILDGAFYLEWARGLIAGHGGPEGAYYLAPLYPWFLAALFGTFGERWLLLTVLQQTLSVATAGLLGLVALRAGGRLAGAAAAALFLLHPPLMYFAARPVGETLALAFLAGALAWRTSGEAGAAWRGGLASLAALGRPNLILLPAVWALGERVVERRRLAAALTLGAAVLVIVPVALRNLGASGHLVPISSNAGITAFQGNGPHALGVYAVAPGVSGDLLHQREEATAVARSVSGREDLDPVEADRWWGRQAVAARLADPAGTLVLAARRAYLLLDSSEHGLDYHPALDLNPWRLTLRPGGSGKELALVPFAVLAGLAAAGVGLRGFGGTGGWRLWAAVATSALAPLVFYVSSRYRLPVAGLLCVPAGVGVAALAVRTAGGLRDRMRGVVPGVVVVLVSLTVPSAALQRSAMATGMSNRSSLFLAAGDVAAAERDGRRAVRLDPRSATVRFNLGVVYERTGRAAPAEIAYREALALDPTHVEAAAALGRMLIRRGAAAEAVPLLESCLGVAPAHEGCWRALVVARLAAGDPEGAHDAATAATAAGVPLPPGLLAEVEATLGAAGKGP